MGQKRYKEEEVWLEAYFNYSDAISFTKEGLRCMLEEGISLPEILHAFRNPQVDASDRDHDGCKFTLVGRNCDDEIIEIQGGFNSETQVVFVFSARKLR